MENNNRLQFIHCDTLFATREEAKAYITGGDFITITRPSLYAEPMVLKYGDANNPNIILAIGSVGDGETPSMNNKVFLIDFAELQESIKAIESDKGNTESEVDSLKGTLNKVIAACGLSAEGVYVKSSNELLQDANSLSEADEALAKAVKDNYDELSSLIKSNNFKAESSSSIYHQLTETEDGNVLKSEVKLAPYKTIGNVNLPNVILSEGEGLYTNVRMSYDEEANTINFGVNDSVNSFKLPDEVHLVSGEYDTDSESLVLTLSNDEKVSINLSKLIGEWTVLGDKSETPIVLTKKEVTSVDMLRGASDYQDVLNADVRLADEVYSEVKDNILTRYNKNTLYVKGTADNIKFYDANGNETTVQDALRNAKTKISTRDYNIIVEKEDGIYARAKLDYSEATNTLTFDNGVDGIKTFKLSNSSLIEDARYDAPTESLILRFRYTTGGFEEITIPLTGLFTEWEPENDNHTVTIKRSEHNINGRDTVSADVNISNAENNILTVVGHELYVKGTADNIQYKDGQTVADALDNVASDVNISELRELITSEAEARQAADNDIKASINVETAARQEKDAELEKAIHDVEDAVVAEQHRAEMAEQELSHKIDLINDCSEQVSDLNEKVVKLESDFNSYTAKADAVHTQLTDKVTEVENETEANTSNLVKFEANLQAEIQRATNREDSIEKKLDGHIAGATESLETEVKELQTKVNDLEVKAATNEQNINSVSGNLSAHITDSNAKFDAVGSTIKTLDNEVDTLSTNVSSVSTRLENHIAESEKAHASFSESLTSLRSQVGNEIVRAQTAEANLSNALTAEVNRASGEEKRLETLINGNQTSISNVQDSVTALSGRVDGIVKEIADGSTETKAEIKRVEDALNAEVQRSTNQDTVLQTNIDAVAKDLETEANRAKEAENGLKTTIDANTAKIDSATTNITSMLSDIASLKAEDTRLTVVPQESDTVRLTASKTDSGTILSAGVKLRTDSENIILSNGNGIYAKVRMDYNRAENVISLLVNDSVVDTYKLSEHSLVENGYYDSVNKEIVLVVVEDDGTSKEIRVPVADIINEWKVDNGTNNPISLSKTTDSTGVDVLKAELEISTEAHNAILNQNGTLYVSNQAKDLTALWSGDEITIQKAIENIKTETDKVEGIYNDVESLKTDMTQVKNDLTVIKGDVSALEVKVEQNTENININKGSIESLTNQFGDLSSQVTNLSNQFNDLENTVNNYEDRITNLETQLSTTNQTINNLTQQINEIRQEVGMDNPDTPSVVDRLNAIEAMLADLIDFETY